ncbi:MAG: lipopolysaccharide heptosyltransferase II [Phycisphaerae bacterium]
MRDEDLRTRSFQRILLIKPSSLGDIIHALPVLHGLRRRFENAQIDWLIGKPFVPLLAGHPEISELIPFDRKRFGRVGRSWSATKEFTRFLRSLRQRRYDLIVDIQGLFRSGFMARATGAAVRIGFRDAREGAWIFYNRHLTPATKDMHAVTRNWLAAAPLGFADAPIRFDLGENASCGQEARALLQTAPAAPATRWVAVIPGARWETKVWPPDRFSQTIDRLQATSDIRCVLVGGPDDVDLCAGIARACTSSPLNLAGKTTLPLLTGVLREADCILGHDSGAMHLGAALDRPLVCITGPTNPIRTGPYQRLDDVLRLDLACSPCYLRRLAQCGHQHQCMRDLSVDMITGGVMERLDRPNRRDA